MFARSTLRHSESLARKPPRTTSTDRKSLWHLSIFFLRKFTNSTVKPLILETLFTTTHRPQSGEGKVFVGLRQFKLSLNLHIIKEYPMAKTKDSNGTGTAPARKRVSKTAEPAIETKSNVFPINLDEEIRKRAFE